MDPAEQHQHALAAPGAILGSHEQGITLLSNNFGHVNPGYARPGDMASVTVTLCRRSAAPGVSSVPRESYVCDPEPFDGDLAKCQGFLIQCRLVFSQRLLVFFPH